MTDLFGHGRHEISAPGARYLLVERWSDAPLAGFIGMNPSNAGAERSDPTFARSCAFARRWGLGGVAWVNLVPFRSSNPDDALRILEETKAGLNQVAERQMADANGVLFTQARFLARFWVCGWGDKGAAMERTWPGLVRAVTNTLYRPSAPGDFYNGSWTFGAFALTKGGAPAHILARGRSRIPDTAPLRRYPVELGILVEEFPLPRGG